MQIPIVNEQDEVIGYQERDTRNPKNICRVTGLWVTDPDGNILLAQRSLKKKNGPGLWGPAVSGTVEKGETYESNIIKEAEEEIGLKGYKFDFGKKVRISTNHEYFGQWFTVVVKHDYPFIKNEIELEKMKWFSKDELNKFFKENPQDFLPSFGKWKDMFF